MAQESMNTVGQMALLRSKGADVTRDTKLLIGGANAAGAQPGLLSGQQLVLPVKQVDKCNCRLLPPGYLQAQG